MRAGVLVAVASLVVGCATAVPAPPAPSPAPPTAAAQLLTEAQVAEAAGRQRAALALYGRVADEHPQDPAAADALQAIALLRVDSASPLRDYRLARPVLARLATDYPQSRWAPSARVWRNVLTELERCQDDATELRGTLDAMKRLDLELERRP